MHSIKIIFWVTTVFYSQHLALLFWLGACIVKFIEYAIADYQEVVVVVVVSHPLILVAKKNQPTTPFGNSSPSDRSMEAKIAPSMLSSDFANLASEAHRMLRFGADWLHMDIMVRPSPFVFLLEFDLFRVLFWIG